MINKRWPINCLIIFLILNIHSVCGQRIEPKITTQNIIQFDLSKDTVLLNILEDVTYKPQYEKKYNSFTVNINKYKSGILIKISRNTNDIFDPRPEPFGYSYVNNNLFIFNYTTDYDFQLSASGDWLKIKTALVDNSINFSDVDYYYIIEDIFAKFSIESGWIWSDGKDDQ